MNIFNEFHFFQVHNDQRHGDHLSIQSLRDHFFETTECFWLHRIAAFSNKSSKFKILFLVKAQCFHIISNILNRVYISQQHSRHCAKCYIYVILFSLHCSLVRVTFVFKDYLTHLFDRYFLNTYYVAGIILKPVIWQ